MNNSILPFLLVWFVIKPNFYFFLICRHQSKPSTSFTLQQCWSCTFYKNDDITKLHINTELSHCPMLFVGCRYHLTNPHGRHANNLSDREVSTNRLTCYYRRLPLAHGKPVFTQHIKRRSGSSFSLLLNVIHVRAFINSSVSYTNRCTTF